MGYYLYLDEWREPSLLRQVEVFTDLPEAITDSLDYICEYISLRSGGDPKESKFKLDTDLDSINHAEEFDDKDWEAINLFLRRFKQQSKQRNDVYWLWRFNERNFHRPEIIALKLEDIIHVNQY